jgi:DNA-binding GntR family transcriptional regulator
MKNGKKIEAQNNKEPYYVKIYEELYDEVIRGVYKAGEQLPPEVKLAEKYKVSRNTLRQALTILCEDGLIFNVQGKGNFVSQTFDQRTQGIEKLDNLLFAAAKVDCDEIKMLYNYGPPAKIVQDKLNITASEITLSSNNIYFNKGVPISTAYMEIPMRIIADMDMDLNQEKDIHELLNSRLFEMASTSSLRFAITTTEESISEFLRVEQNTPAIFIEEILYDHMGTPLALCKYYLLPTYYSVNITRKK